MALLIATQPLRHSLAARGPVSASSQSRPRAIRLGGRSQTAFRIATREGGAEEGACTGGRNQLHAVVAPLGPVPPPWQSAQLRGAFFAKASREGPAFAIREDRD